MAVVVLAATAVAVAAASLGGTSALLEESRQMHERDLVRIHAELDRIADALRDSE